MGQEKKVWKTADGREIAYEDLTDDHLMNICTFLKRKNLIINDNLINELEKRMLDPKKFYLSIWLKNLVWGIKNWWSK